MSDYDEVTLLSIYDTLAEAVSKLYGDEVELNLLEIEGSSVKDIKFELVNSDGDTVGLAWIDSDGKPVTKPLGIASVS